MRETSTITKIHLFKVAFFLNILLSKVLLACRTHLDETNLESGESTVCVKLKLTRNDNFSHTINTLESNPL